MEVCTTLCGECKKKLKNVDNVYFYLCEWKAHGQKLGEEDDITFCGEADDPDKFVFFEEGNNSKWQFLNIEVKKLQIKD